MSVLCAEVEIDKSSKDILLLLPSPLLSSPLVTGRTIAFYFLLMLNTLKLQSYKILYLELQPPLPCLSALSLSTHDWTLAIIKRRREGGGEGGGEGEEDREEKKLLNIVQMVIRE